MDKKNFATQIVTIDESIREIASLQQLYNDLLSTSPKTELEAESLREQAKYARERILRLSLHMKTILEKAEAQEQV